MRKLTIIYFLISTLSILFSVTKSYSQDSISTKIPSLKIEQSENIKKIIAKKRVFNKKPKIKKGYRIQIYYGTEKGAENIMSDFKTAFEEVPTKLWLDKVEWKVWVGSYKTKLETDRALKEIKEKFPNAIPVPDKIKI